VGGWPAARSRLRVIVQAVTALPLVLGRPDGGSVSYLLMFLGPLWLGLGSTMLRFGLHPPSAFSFGGLVVGSIIYSTPFGRAAGLQTSIPRE